MKLIAINGKLWELTALQCGYGQVENSTDAIQQINTAVLEGRSLHRGRLRPHRKGVVRSKASAIIEITVNNLLSQREYVIYHCSKGFYCVVRGSRVYLDVLHYTQHTAADTGDTEGGGE